MKDLYLECNDRGMTELEFQSSFCNYCRQTRCSRAGWSKTSWEQRINTQVDRLLINPNIHLQSESERWAEIPNFELPQEVLEIWGSKKVSADLAEILENVPETESPLEIEGASAEEPASPRNDTSESVTEGSLDATSPQILVPDNKPSKRANTKAQEIMIGEAPDTPSAPAVDPWAPQPASIKVGGTFKMGG